MRALGRVFLQGLVAIVPMVFTLYLLWWLGAAAERGLGGVLKVGLPESLYLPGMGLTLGILLVLVVGLVMRAWFVRHLLLGAERLVQRIPLLGSIYGSVRDLMAFVGGREPRDVRAVTVGLADPGVRFLGLVTCESAAELTHDEQDRECLAVYLPMSYALGGFMVIVPRASLRTLAMPAEVALRTALTAGMSGKAAPDDAAPVRGGLGSDPGRSRGPREGVPHGAPAS